MRHFILLLTNFRDQIKPYLVENKQNKTKSNSLGKDSGVKHSLFIMEDRVLQITALQIIPCIHIHICCRTSILLM